MLSKSLTKNIIFSALIAFSMFTLPAFAEDEVKNENLNSTDNIQEVENRPPLENYSGFGVAAGLLSGSGFTYRQYFAQKFGYKVTGVGFFDQSQTFWDLGLQGMYVISENDWLRFYGLIGISTYTTRRNNYTYVTPYPADLNDYNQVYIPSRDSSNYESYNSAGIGIGLEMGRQSHGISLALDLPLIFSFRNFKMSSFYPIPQISLVYNF